MRLNQTDFTNQKIGSLTAVVLDRVWKGHAYWICQCDCGKKTTVRGDALYNKTVLSCGCYKIVNNKWHNTTHGKSKDNLYFRWQSMIQRCCNPKDQAFPNYGGRGITVCHEWLVSFEQFASDMGNPPTVDHTLERMDNEKGYCKENCKWATRAEQSANRRTNLDYWEKRNAK